MAWQVRFDGGRQQRYLAHRTDVLRYILAVGPHSQDPRFQIWSEGPPIILANGSDGGRSFTLSEVFDLARPGEWERIQRELDDAAG